MAISLEVDGRGRVPILGVPTCDPTLD